MKQLWLRLSTLFRRLLHGNNMAEKKEIAFKLWTEKVVGHGEDAPPLLVNEENGCAVGVFDGMGGSGAALCESDLG